MREQQRETPQVIAPRTHGTPAQPPAVTPPPAGGQPPAPVHQPTALSVAEVTVLRLLAAGHPAVVAAEATCTTLGSVARTTTSLRNRFSVDSTVQALGHARRTGLI